MGHDQASRDAARDNGSVHALGAADLLIGRAIELSLQAHHRYRLWRLGRLDALEPPDDGSPWCREAPPPRDGCAIDVLIDGEEALAAIAEAIRDARRSVRMAGWHTAPHFALDRGEPPSDGFRIVVLLPSKANNGEEDTRGMLAYLADADSGRGRFLVTTIDAMTARRSTGSTSTPRSASSTTAG
jgi:phosphatidylserine/phosphatidylglycerophosphate/cardiolipin synthase-like enzyme